VSRVARTVVALGVLLALGQTSCVQVHAYERGRLAHHTMVPDDGASPSLDHVYAVHEGASGGDLQATAGCGCN